jgi:hypothetical protein
MIKHNYEKAMKKSRLFAAYKKVQAPALKKALLWEYERLCVESDLTDNMLARHLVYAILPAVTFYRVFVRHGYAKDQACSVIRESLLESARPMAKAFQAMGRLPFFFSLLRFMCPASVKTSFGETGWRIEWKENSGRRIAFDAHSCFYDAILKKYGTPELLPFFCELDDIVYGNIPRIKWGRTKTIGNGDAICDFCFFKEDQACPSV